MSKFIIVATEHHPRTNTFTNDWLCWADTREEAMKLMKRLDWQEQMRQRTEKILHGSVEVVYSWKVKEVSTHASKVTGLKTDAEVRAALRDAPEKRRQANQFKKDIEDRRLNQLREKIIAFIDHWIKPENREFRKWDATEREMFEEYLGHRHDDMILSFYKSFFRYKTGNGNIMNPPLIEYNGPTHRSPVFLGGFEHIFRPQKLREEVKNVRELGVAQGYF